MKNVSDSPKACGLCGKTYRPTSNRQKYCVECQREDNKRRCRERYRRTYVPKGYNQQGASNNAWRGGIYGGYYQRKAYDHYGRKCGECGSGKSLCVHHKDEDRYNNELDNLEVLCRSCHARRHELHKNFSNTLKKV